MSYQKTKLGNRLQIQIRIIRFEIMCNITTIIDYVVPT